VASDPRGDQALPPALILSGPTAAGKTAVAMALSERFDVDLISMDSAQVYRGLDIGAAKPDAATLERCPHALIDIRSPWNPYSAADFVDDCDRLMARSAASGRLPVLVGGTTLYLRAVLYGLDAMPAADQGLRKLLAEEFDADGGRTLHRELQQGDPDTAGRVNVNDPQRLLRAVEVLRLSGKGPSHWQRQNRWPRFPSLRLVITPGDRAILHRRIAQRLDQMLEEGFMEEAVALFESPRFDPDLPAFRSVGYRQAWDYLSGRVDLETFRARARAASRQLAKRQLTALRQLHAALWYDSGQVMAIDRIFGQVQGFLETHR
jgi:tRNA dimethylallyltransferase